MSGSGALPPGTVELLRERDGCGIRGRQLADWAVRALEAGFETESLVELAGLALESDPGYFEANALFHRALGELGIDESAL